MQPSGGTEPRPFFAWSEADCSVGLRRYDEEHQRLADLINQVHQAALQRRDRALCAVLLDRLHQEARNHFDSEEAALRETDYPGQEAHFEEHTHLLAALREMLQRHQAGTQSALLLVDFLKNWLIHHIKTSDRKYTAHLRSHGYR